MNAPGRKPVAAATVGVDGPRHKNPTPLLSFSQHMNSAKRSKAVTAFARRRAGQIVHKDRTAESNLYLAPGQIAREAAWSLTAFLEIMGPYRMNMPPLTRTECLKYVEGAGASLIALWERLQVEVPDDE